MVSLTTQEVRYGDATTPSPPELVTTTWLLRSTRVINITSPENLWVSRLRKQRTSSSLSGISAGLPTRLTAPTTESGTGGLEEKILRVNASCDDSIGQLPGVELVQ